MQSARRVLIVTRDKKLAASLENALRTTQYIVNGICSSAIFNRRKAEMANADMILLGARELIAEARRARSIGRRLAASHPPVIVVLRDDQLLHGLSVMAPGQRLIFAHHLSTHLTQVIDLSLEGLIVIPDRVLQHLRSGALRANSLGTLTDQEASVLDLLGQGAPNGRIAEFLGLPLSRAKSVVRSIISKLGMPNRTAVAVFYCQKRSLQ